MHKCIHFSAGRRGYKGQKGESGLSADGKQFYVGWSHQMTSGSSSSSSSSSSSVVFLQPIAFSTSLDEDIARATEYRVIHFNVILANIGDGYDPSTGVFTAPLNGSYLVGFSGVSYRGQSVLLHLVRNGQRLLSAFDNSGCECCSQATSAAADAGVNKCAGSASNAGILSLDKGDKVWVELPDGYGLHNALYHNYASFYGYFLFPAGVGATPRG